MLQTTLVLEYSNHCHKLSKIKLKRANQKSQSFFLQGWSQLAHKIHSSIMNHDLIYEKKIHADSVPRKTISKNNFSVHDREFYCVGIEHGDLTRKCVTLSYLLFLTRIKIWHFFFSYFMNSWIAKYLHWSSIHNWYDCM